MDFLLAEIDRKKKQIDQNEVTSNKKYFRRGDLAAKQAVDYRKKQEDKLKEKEEKAGKRAADDEILFSFKRKKDEGEAKTALIPREEVIRRLRERVEPIRLFGESDDEACQRLRRIEMLVPEVNKGLRNDFKAAMEKIDQEYLAELIKQQGGEQQSSESEESAQTEDDGTTLEDIKDLATNMGKGDENLDQDVILTFIQFLLGLWAKDYKTRSDDSKRSLESKLSGATQSQTESYLKPLLRKLKHKKTPRDILSFLTSIIMSLLEREYVKANDSYLQMAIGNAPWPIGVTMVGIHARTGREKIFSQNVAHVLNDETQRKYIQGLKRLMTFAKRSFLLTHQSLWNTTLLSDCVM
ncbi:Pre-mRNA-splicing factor 18 [Desmophyllum pertusum]|uniref:Pre-mRNA-splicing factor 18 n=1 Tax=Desmophyllum pertusum TaxID=174260 RepID=A0A9X0CXM9_9CNID|nr:Pre-mRNA-splicing factor 18 [Desmophyllum pertusum]